MKMSAILSIMVVLGCCWLESIKAESYLPSLFWDAENPFFKCSDPIIRMPNEHHINVHCADTFTHNYIRVNQEQSVKKVRMVEVPDEEHYNKCNNEGGTQRLYCGETQNVTTTNKQVCNNPGKEGCTPFYYLFASPVSLQSGKTYYYIGTDETGNNIPCKGDNASPPLKFKVYVCTDEETRAGKCQPCQTEACYYKQCSEQCDDWVSDSKVFRDLHGECYQHQTKRCVDKLTSATSNKTKEIKITCPVIKCEDWEANDLTQYEKGKCVIPQMRECIQPNGVKETQYRSKTVTCPSTNCGEWILTKTTTAQEPTKRCFLNHKRICIFKVNSNTGQIKVAYDEHRVMNTTCPNTNKIVCPTVTPVTTATPATPVKQAKQIEYNDDDLVDRKTYIYIIIGVSIASVLVGIMLGCCLAKLCSQKIEQAEVSKTVETTKVVPMEGHGPIVSYDNKNFHLDPVLEDIQSPFQIGDIAFIPTTQEVGTTKRQVMVARSVSFYNPDVSTGHYYRRNTSESGQYRPPQNVQESKRNVMRHPSATSKTVLIRHHSDVTERPRSDSDTSVFNLKSPEDMISEEV